MSTCEYCGRTIGDFKEDVQFIRSTKGLKMK
jgi:hypothetical protein